MRKLLMTALMATLAVGCGKKKDGDKGSDKAAEGAGGAGGNLPALKADPDPGAITAADKAPFESLKFRMLDQRGENGWPKYDIYNLGKKPVAFIAVNGYAYDKDGNQVAKTSVPLSWNGKIDPGGKTDFSIEIGFSDDKVPASAVSYDVCYDSIKFDGDANTTDQSGRCPDKKPKDK